MIKQFKLNMTFTILKKKTYPEIILKFISSQTLSEHLILT